MSTEHQQYSLANQSLAIQRYAENHNLEIVRTYADPGKTGLVFSERHGLRQLIEDVVRGNVDYRLILVFDVSRWGRFQDLDESGHYEFLCRSAGIPVHYCAEAFGNDGSLASMIMKALKRMMASEYSRELSCKVSAGAVRLAQLGFRQGGVAGYGFRRMLVSPAGDTKQILSQGQRKSIQEDRVVLVQGPDEEVSCVREIFRMFADEGKMPTTIAEELNARGIRYTGGKIRDKWYAGAVNRLLRQSKYAGCMVYGRSTQKLHTPRIWLPPKLWIVKPGSWPAIIDRATFDRAQQRFLNQTFYKTDEELLADLKKLLIEKGDLSERLVNEAPNLPSLMAYAHRFGSLTEAFALIGFKGKRAESMISRRRTLALREKLIEKILACATDEITIFRPDHKHRIRLRMPDQTLVSIEVLRACRRKRGLRWDLNTHEEERNFITLIARLNENQTGFHDFHVVSDLKGLTLCALKENDCKVLPRGKRLSSLVDLVQVVQQVKDGNRG